jgi:hypothetical protein
LILDGQIYWKDWDGNHCITTMCETKDGYKLIPMTELFSEYELLGKIYEELELTVWDV